MEQAFEALERGLDELKLDQFDEHNKEKEQ